MTKERNYPSRTAAQFVVRLPDGMRERIAEAAEMNARSMNAEIVARLQESFEPRTVKIDMTVEEGATVGDIKRAIERLKPEISADQPIELTLTTIKAGASRP